MNTAVFKGHPCLWPAVTRTTRSGSQHPVYPPPHKLLGEWALQTAAVYTGISFRSRQLVPTCAYPMIRISSTWYSKHTSSSQSQFHTNTPHKKNYEYFMPFTTQNVAVLLCRTGTYERIGTPWATARISLHPPTCNQQHGWNTRRSPRQHPTAPRPRNGRLHLPPADHVGEVPGQPRGTLLFCPVSIVDKLGVACSCLRGTRGMGWRSGSSGGGACSACRRERY